MQVFCVCLDLNLFRLRCPRENVPNCAIEVFPGLETQHMQMLRSKSFLFMWTSTKYMFEPHLTGKSFPSYAPNWFLSGNVQTQLRSGAIPKLRCRGVVFFFNIESKAFKSPSLTHTLFKGYVQHFAFELLFVFATSAREQDLKKIPSRISTPDQ